MKESRAATPPSTRRTTSKCDGSLHSSSVISNTMSHQLLQSSTERNTRAVWVGRTLFLVSLCIVAVLLGVLAYTTLTHSEVIVAEKQFQSIASRAVLSAARIVKRKLGGTSSLAQVVSKAKPDWKDWPFVVVDGLEDIAAELISASDGRQMGFAPLVHPQDLAAFEDFAYLYYNTTRFPEPYPPGTGQSSFGRGIYGEDPTLNTTDNRYHDNRVERTYASPHTVFTPILQHSTGAAPGLMLNLRFEERRGRAIDHLLQCSQQQSQSCAQITNFLSLANQNVDKSGPAAVILQPIYPNWNRTALTGLIASTIVWSEVFKNVFAKEVSGIQCILESDDQTFTYTIKEGLATLEGQGSKYSQDYAKYKISTTLTGDLFGERSPSYTLSLYPTQRFFDVYSTRNPLLAVFGAVFIILVTSLLFILYDYYVQREFSNKKELLEAKRLFMRFVSHEVRTPLNSLRLGLSVIVEEMKDTLEDTEGTECETLVEEEQTEATASAEIASRGKVCEWVDLATEVHRNAQSAVDVLSDLLHYDKIESGKLNLELSIFDFQTFIQQTTSEFKLEALRRHVNYELHERERIGDRSQPVLVGDCVRLTQSLRNLISNGLKFTPEGGSLNITVQELHLKESILKQEVKLQDGNEYALHQVGLLSIAVADTGAGMSPDQLHRLFKDGVQFNVNNLQKGHGSGLGLFITKGIVERHGGRLAVESEGLGKGTTFTLLLPLYENPCTNETAIPLGGEMGPTSREQAPVVFRPLHILVVDDAKTNRKLLIRLLEKKGHRCQEAEDGAVAVQAVKSSMNDPFDTVLLDYEMPEMNGPQAALAMRELGHDFFIVGITGNVLPEDVLFFKNAGANAVLSKPLHLPDLESLWVEYGLAGNCCL